MQENVAFSIAIKCAEVIAAANAFFVKGAETTAKTPRINAGTTTREASDLMTEEKRNKILVRAIATYGEESQINMAIEEMAELTKALCKLKRAKTTAERDAAIGNIIEETADVQITLDQVKIIVKNDTEAMQKFKLQRLDKRLFCYQGEMKNPELLEQEA